MAYGKIKAQTFEEHIEFVASLPFIGFHVLALVCAILVPPTLGDLALVVAMYSLRMFGVAGGYHRYFAHRSYSTSRAFQFCLAFLGGTALQKGGLWWASHHRHHHRYSDQIEDVHSPVQRGFFWSHMGWIMSSKWNKTDYEGIPDMAKFPELVFLNEHHLVAPVLFGAILAAVGYFTGGVHGLEHVLTWGFLVSTVVLWHGTFTINSLSHVFGRRRFATTDDSRNSLVLALITGGEGWHNNHHHYPGSMSQGFYWWEVDVTAYAIRALALVGVVWDVRAAPARVLNAGRGKVVPNLRAQIAAATLGSAEPAA